MLELSSEDIYKLFARCRSGQASMEEEEQLEELASLSEENRRIIDQLDELWSVDCPGLENDELISQGEVREQVWQAVFERSKNNDDTSRNFSRYLKVAAIILLICLTPVLLYSTFEVQVDDAAAITSITKQTLPGQKLTITMRDGSVVWLNSGSRITYASNFNDSLRIIELEGQAFFEVFKDENKPFVVRCQGLDVEALGTSFDVNGYKGPVQVSLVSGKVRVSASFEDEIKDLMLEPGQFSVVDVGKQVFENGTFDPAEVLAWKEGRLHFKNATISEIVPKLELWYGVEIVNQHLVDGTRPVTTTFERENLDNVLTNIREVLDFEYDIEGNKVIIKTKELPM